MKYNVLNKKFENFQKKFDAFEKKYYLEIQDYKEFKVENFEGVNKFTNIVRKILIGVCVISIAFSIIIIGIALAIFLSFTVFSGHSIHL